MEIGRGVIDREGLEGLFRVLSSRGYTIVGPTVRDGAIIYESLSSIGDLPEGWRDEQGAGRYRLRRRDDRALFGYTLGPYSLRRFLQPPHQLLFTARSGEEGFEIIGETVKVSRLAFLGVRPCELRGVKILDRVLTGGDYRDPSYSARREKILVIAVNCTEPGGTCFCLSMGTGPVAGSGFDILLTEVIGGRHYFLVEAGSGIGEEILKALPLREASKEEVEEGERLLAGARERMGRSLEVEGLRDLLYNSYDHPHWDEVSKRCLACGNCTFVCPTCFCTTLEDRVDLRGRAERWQRWDSCFTLDFTYIHGGSLRSSIRSRYRHWVTHKLGTWIEQFGMSGCVGCGRCITWCPVGIDITRVVETLREKEVGDGGS